MPRQISVEEKPSQKKRAWGSPKVKIRWGGGRTRTTSHALERSHRLEYKAGRLVQDVYRALELERTVDSKDSD